MMEDITEVQPIKKTKKEKPFNLRDIMTKMGGVNVSVMTKDAAIAPTDRKYTKFPCHVLNMIMGGGVPAGKFIEIFGKKSTAKSTLAMLLVNDVVEQGGYVLVLDKDADSWDFPTRNLQLGMNPELVDRVMMAHPLTVEDVFNTIDAFLGQVVIKGKNKDVPVVVVWDSIAGTTSKAERAANLGEKNFMDHAKIITTAHRRLEADMIEGELKNVTFVWINQARNNMAQSYGYQEPVTFGGDAPGFFSAIRLELTRLKQLAGLKGKTTYPVGVIIKVKTIKNKVFSPYQTCNIRLLFTKGIDEAGTTFDWLEANGLIKKSTANEIKAGNLPLKLMLEDGYIYFDKGRAFKELFNSETGDRIKAFMSKFYADTLDNITSIMAGDSDIIEQDVEDDVPPTASAAMGVPPAKGSAIPDDEISLE
jgi:protein RecA